MKIIAGKHKNRNIPSVRGANYRPSTMKFREALFSILSSGGFSESAAFMNAKVLDLFSGTGSIGLEALSRGARHVTFVDNNPDNLRALKEFITKIGEEENTDFFATDATRLSMKTEKYDLVFMDPPYHNSLIKRTINNLVAQDLLSKQAIIAVEMEVRTDLKLSEYFSLVKEKIYGNNKLLILSYEQE